MRSMHRTDPRAWCFALLLAFAAIACSGDLAGKIPCNDNSNCPSAYPTCGTGGFCVAGAPAARIDVVSGNSQSAVAGTALAQPLVVRVSDAKGNAVQGVTVSWSATGGQVSSASGTTGPDGQASVTATLATVAGANTFTAATSGVGGTATFTATGTPDAAATLAVAAADSITAGQATSATVTAKDKYGNVATGYRGTVTLSSSDPAADLPAPYAFSSGDAGLHGLQVTLKTAGSRSLTVSDGTLSDTKQAITVNPAAAASLVVSGFPATTTAGIAGPVTVTALDAFGNTASGYLGTVKVTSSDGAAALPPDYQFVANDAGVHALAVTLKTATAGATASITVADVAAPAIIGQQTAIAVNPGPAATLLVAGFPATAAAGTAGSVTVTATDQFGNTATGYVGTVKVTSSDAAATLPPDYQFVANDAGVHSLLVTLKTAVANASITVTDVSTATITGRQTSIVVNGGPPVALSIGGFPNPVLAGTPGSATVVAKDVYGNPTSQYTGNVTLTADTSSNTPLTHQFVPGDGGIFTFTVILDAVGPPNTTLTATDGTLSASQTGIVVNEGPIVYGSTATLLAGGTKAGLIFVTGGSGVGAVTVSNTWFYDPATSSLTVGPALAFPRAFHTATQVANDQVLVAGGDSGGAAGFSEFELCDLAASSCTVTATVTPTASRCNAAAALVSSTPARVLVAGGDDCAGGAEVDTWDLWDSSDPTHAAQNGTANKLTIGRHYHTATLVGTGTVLLAGGASTATADLFTLGSTPATSTVTATSGAMQAARIGHTATLLSTATAKACPTPPCVLIAGGVSSTGTQTWEIYQASSKTFPTNSATEGHELVAPQREYQSAALFSDGKVLLAGGDDGINALKTTEIFDTTAATLTFTSGAELQVERTGAAAAFAPVQKVMVLVGGTTVGPSTEQATDGP